MVKDYLSLTIRNKMDPSMQDKALTIRTTKADKKQHGLGRQIIYDIVRRYPSPAHTLIPLSARYSLRFFLVFMSIFDTLFSLIPRSAAIFFTCSENR